MRNGLGLAQGGIQLSQMIAPTRINSGTNTGPGACNRWGFSTPIDPAMLHTLYGSHETYYNMVGTTSKQNFLNGYLLLPDVVQDMVDATTLACRQLTCCSEVAALRASRGPPFP